MNLPEKKRETGALREVWISHNRTIDYMRSLTVQRASQGVKVNQTSNGTLLKVEVPRVPSVAGKVVRMRVETVGFDELTCTNLEEGGIVQVAKGFNLRQAGWDGVTVPYILPPYPTSLGNLSITYDVITPVYRTATIGTYVEHQVISPYFVEGFSEIYAAQCENTGIPGVEWVDLNADARAWTMVL